MVIEPASDFTPIIYELVPVPIDSIVPDVNVKLAFPPKYSGIGFDIPPKGLHYF